MYAYPRKRKHRNDNSFSMLIAFLFGVAIGFCASNGLALFKHSPAPQTPPSASVSTTEETTSSPQPPPASAAAVVEARWAGQHLFIAIAGTTLDDDAADQLFALQPGAVVLRPENLVDVKQTQALVEQIARAMNPGAGRINPPLITLLPALDDLNPFDPKAARAADLGAIWDLDAAQACGAALGEACEERGIQIVFGPLLDVYEPGSEATLKRASFGIGQDVVTAMGYAYAQGLIQAGIVPVARRYPGMGAAKPAGQQPFTSIDRDIPGLAKLMYPFAEMATHRIPGILVADAAVPALAKDNPKTPACTSEALVWQMIREQWSFSGVVIADDVAAASMTERQTPEEAAIAVLNAGCDAMLFLDTDLRHAETVCAAIEKAVEDGQLNDTLLASSRLRIEGLRRWLVHPRELLSRDPAGKPSEDELNKKRAEAAAQTTEDAQESTNEAPAESPAVVHEESGPAEENEPESTPESEPAEQETPAPESAKAADPAPEPVETVEPEKDKEAKKVEQEKPVPAKAGQDDSPKEAPVKPVLAAQPPNTEKVSHPVAAGEMLSRIAGKYGVAVKDLRAWNGLTTDSISEGQVLTVYIPQGKEEPAASATEEAPAITEAVAALEEEPPLPDASTERTAPAAAAPATVTHTIEKGETLSGIARKYSTTPAKILEMNGMKEGDAIYFGRKLKVPAVKTTEPAQ